MDGTWEDLPTGWSDRRYGGAIPELLYRYRAINLPRLDALVDFEIAGEGVFLAGFGSLNDPDEGRIRYIVDEAPAPAWAVSQFNDITDHIMRVCCFTTKPLNGPMWSHYGIAVCPEGPIACGGMCIEYDAGEKMRETGIYPVSYSNERPIVDLSAPFAVQCRQLSDAILVKSGDWEYEAEWRITAVLDARPPFPDNLENNARLRFNGGVKSVIFGMHVLPQHVDRIQTRLVALGRSVPIRKVVRDADTQHPIIIDAS